MSIEEILQELQEKHLDKPVEVSTTNKKKAAVAVKDNEQLARFNENSLRLFRKWLERGDGVAVYENQDLGSVLGGHKKFCSFGSAAAQIEDREPPVRMPDIGAANWAYQLAAKYKVGEGGENASESR